MSDEISQFRCVICGCVADRAPWLHRFGRRIHSRPPICIACEDVTYRTFSGGARRPHGTRIIGGSRGDRRAALRLFAIADELEREANTRKFGARCK